MFGSLIWAAIEPNEFNMPLVNLVTLIMNWMYSIMAGWYAIMFLCGIFSANIVLNIKNSPKLITRQRVNILKSAYDTSEEKHMKMKRIPIILFISTLLCFYLNKNFTGTISFISFIMTIASQSMYKMLNKEIPNLIKGFKTL